MLWQPCLVCDAETSNYCSDCVQTQDDGTKLTARFYCDIDCEKKDEMEHLKVHMSASRPAPPNMERAIRAGKIAQSLYYAFREGTWTYDMKKVCIKRDQDHELVSVLVTDGAGAATAPGGLTDCKSHAGGWLIKFPVEAFSVLDDDAKYALLVDHSSIWAFVVMHSAVQALFQGESRSASFGSWLTLDTDIVEDVQTDIKETVHYPTDKAARIVHAQGTFGFETRRHGQLYSDEDKRGDTKGVYEITLKCGSKIALDLAGAQWSLQYSNNQHEPVTSWTDYWSRWGNFVKYRIPFRSHALKHAAKMINYRLITSQTIIMEASLYFNILMTSACKAELDFHPSDLLVMDVKTYHKVKQRFLTEAEKYIQKRPAELDFGNHCDVFDTFDMRHPKVIADAPKLHRESNESLPFDIGDMAKFDWKIFSRQIQQPNKEVSWKEKKWAKALQNKRSVYTEQGTWKLLFLEDTLPGPGVHVDCVSENPGWTLS